MTVIASFPHWYEGNHYYAGLYGELARYGVRHAPGVHLSSLHPRHPRRSADLLHIHWAYALWRGERPWRRRRAARRALKLVEEIRVSGIAVIWTVHNLEPHDGYARGERAAYASLRSRVDLCLYHTNHARAEARRLFGTTAADELVVHHGVLHGSPPRKGPEAIRAALGIDRDRRLLLCFGQVRRNKGFDLALDALDSLGDAYHLIVAGRAMDRSGRRVLRAARRHPRASAVEGYVDDETLSSILASADAVLLPYRSVTGSGAFLHALGCARGIVATRLPFFTEVVQSRPEAVTLVDAGSPEALADGVRRQLETPAGRRRTLLDALAAEYAWERCIVPLRSWIGKRTGTAIRHAPEPGEARRRR
jgi:glycosyltransferase involved in cell wall biosynthesis